VFLSVFAPTLKLSPAAEASGEGLGASVVFLWQKI
jgi:hypothetical protein